MQVKQSQPFLIFNYKINNCFYQVFLERMHHIAHRQRQ